jgi:hypothetical protein
MTEHPQSAEPQAAAKTGIVLGGRLHEADQKAVDRLYELMEELQDVARTLLILTQDKAHRADHCFDGALSFIVGELYRRINGLCELFGIDGIVPQRKGGDDA